MEKAKISSIQFFTFICLFELGTAIVVVPGLSAKKDAWLAILLGMIGGLFLFLLYALLFRLYPGFSLTGYARQILGPPIGKLIGILYMFYFLYDGTRDVRDFGNLLTDSTYIYTPLLIINFMIILTIVYVLHHGIEVLARTSEIFCGILFFIGFVAGIIIIFSGQMDLNHLRPVLENGWGPVLKTAFPLTLTFPFGEVIVFAMLLPYLNRPKLGVKTGFAAIGLSGFLLMWTVSVDIGVLGINVASRSSFPLLASISLINLPGLFQRLDALVVLTLIIGGFFKIAILYYGAVICAAETFNVANFRKLLFPIAVVLLISSMTVATNFAEHIKEGLEFVPLYIHIPMQIGIPVVLLIAGFFRKKGQSAND
ncbi:MAG TPA: endospore germination permease [Bacillales bacterium]|nr:endospore germination permease [Bacillales bacterium]